MYKADYSFRMNVMEEIFRLRCLEKNRLHVVSTWQKSVCSNSHNTTDGLQRYEKQELSQELSTQLHSLAVVHPHIHTSHRKFTLAAPLTENHRTQLLKDQ